MAGNIARCCGSPLKTPIAFPAALRSSCSEKSVRRWVPRLSSGRPPRRTFGSSRILSEKKYTKDHEWIELSSDGKFGTIGISTYAARALGDVVYVELPTPDLQVSAGDSIGAVESVKSASDILSPVAGSIIEANNVLEEKPGLINEAPEEGGWIARIEVREREEVEGLMGGEEYKDFTSEGGEEEGEGEGEGEKK